MYNEAPEVESEFAVLCLMAMEEPSSFEEATKLKCWRQAMEEEIEAMEHNKIWELVGLPKGHKPIGLKWVYKIKKDSHSEVVKHKARLVGKGYVQQQGIDFEEVFEPIARLETMRLLLAIATQERWEVHHMDVKCAFLNRDLTEEVYLYMWHKHSVLKLRTKEKRF